MQKIAYAGTGEQRRRTTVLLAALAAALMALLVSAMVSPGGTARAQTTQGVDLHIRKSVSPKQVSVGERQTFTINVTNQGDHRARNVTMKDPLPAKVRFIRASTSRQVPGSCALEPVRTVVCDLGTLRTSNTVTVKIYVKTVEAGAYTNRASVTYGSSTARALESDTSDNSDGAKALVEARKP